jgi:hypothetical protein
MFYTEIVTVCLVYRFLNALLTEDEYVFYVLLLPLERLEAGD